MKNTSHLLRYSLLIFVIVNIFMVLEFLNTDSIVFEVLELHQQILAEEQKQLGILHDRILKLESDMDDANNSVLNLNHMLVIFAREITSLKKLAGIPTNSWNTDVEEWEAIPLPKDSNN